MSDHFPMYDQVVDFIKNLYKKEPVPLHEPLFNGREKEYITDCIDSTFVSSVGEYVSKFENMISEYVGSKFAIATVNGTSALHIALKLSGVKENTEVITQPLTFVATCNAIRYCGADPIFVDIDIDTLGMSPSSLEEFLETQTIIDGGVCLNKNSRKVIKACVPMHTFGHPCRIDKIAEICKKYNIALIEDAAESLGSRYKGKHTGTFGLLGILSFNGNKIITTGGGGMILTNIEELAMRAKHLTTTAKTPHPYEYIHDEVGYNYRMPNINAAIGYAQILKIDEFVKRKRKLALIYKKFFDKLGCVEFFLEPKNAKSNYWLNTVVLKDKSERDKFLEYMIDNKIMVRPVWKLMSNLRMYKNCQKSKITNAQFLEDRIVNIPSSVNYILQD